MATARRFLAGLGTAFFALTAHAAPGTEALIGEVGTALDAGNAAQAQRLADSGLLEVDLAPLQRGRLLLDRGLAQELLGAHDDAMIDFTAAIETHALPPDERAQALLQRGFMLDGLNRLDDAAKDYSAAIVLKTPALATALNNRANVYRRQNHLQEARRDYQAALGAGTAKPQYPYFGLGQIAEAQADKESARRYYAEAVAADPGYHLASDRLSYLGGPVESTLAEPDAITLHPPAEKAVALHTSSARPAFVAPERHKPPAAGPGLRPALDGPSGSSALEVQLGAWRSEPQAQAGWDKAKVRAADALEGLVAHIVRADIAGQGTYYRLRVASLNPAALCARLKSAGQVCVQIRD